jgi:hypothetical protein
VPSLGLSLLRAGKDPSPLTAHLAAIIRQALWETLPAEWLTQPPIERSPAT